MSDTCIIIPTYNESENIANLIKALEKEMKRDFNIIIVDDNSPDGTAKIAESLNDTFGNIIIHQRSGKLGIGSAVIAGMKVALSYNNFKYIATMDADFSHDPKDITRLLMAAKDADLIQGSRYMNGGRIIGWDLYRKMLSSGGNLMCRTLFRTGVREQTTYFRIYSREVAEVIVDNINTSGFEFGITSMLEAKDRGYKIKEVPITFVNRTNGKSKLKFANVLRWNYVIMKLFIHRCLKAVYKKNGNDIAVGSRYIDGGKIEGWGWFRYMVSK